MRMLSQNLSMAMLLTGCERKSVLVKDELVKRKFSLKMSVAFDLSPSSL